MRLTIFATLLAAVSASPLFDKRAGTCTALGTTKATVGGKVQTLRGPFQMSASAPGNAKDGYYAHAGPPSQYPYIIYDVRPLANQIKTKATDFYLTSTGGLVALIAGKYELSFEYNPASKPPGHVAVGTSANPANPVKCTVGASCALNCKVGTNAYNCLASPGYQPEWK